MSVVLALLAGVLVPPAVAAEELLAQEEARGRAVVEAHPITPGEPVVFVGGVVMTAAGDRFDPGFLAVADGRITAVGEGEGPRPEGARVVDLEGRYLTPGLIDTHSHLGVYASPSSDAHSDGNEMTAPTTPGVWAEHSVWPQDPGFQYAVEGGITTLQILPGSANLIGGRGVVMRPIPARGSRAMRFPDAPETVKMACGENPKRVYGNKNRSPSTRMGNLRGQRQAFLDAEKYRYDWREYEVARERWETARQSERRKVRETAGDAPEPPERDLDLETLALVLEGRVLPQIHCYRADDMLSMLQVADEFGFAVRSFHHATEAYKIADVLAAKGVAASVWPEWWGFKLEAYDAIPENAAILSAMGGTPVIHSDSAVTIQRLNQEAAKAATSGRAAGLAISDDEALRWITRNPAWALGIDDQTGTLEVGKRADLVVWDRDPFSVYASADSVWIDGRRVHPRPEGSPWSDFTLGTEVSP